MTRLLAAIACLFLLVAAPRAMADPEDITAASRSVVRVVIVSQTDTGMTLIGHGSGIAVGRDLVVTNAHVVAPLAQDENLRVGIVPSQGKGGWFARVIRYSPSNDLALLKLTEPGNLIPATLFTGPVSDGEDVYAVGYPANVDIAQGLQMDDLMKPTAPVKTHGNVSTGRSAKGYETILHTAPLGAGNSGGPLLDACGRVLGANSFGTVANESDSEFYFAVSTREIVRFLHDAGVTPRISGEPCRSLAEISAAERDRDQAAREANQEQDRIAEEKQSAADAKASRQAELDVFAERESDMALAGLGLILALASAGGAVWLGQQGRTGPRNAAAAAAGLLLVGALFAWFSRPGLSAIDARTRELEASPSPSSTAGKDTSASDLVCILDASRSRVTVSDQTDVNLNWKDGGCVNGRTQYALSGDGWSRVLVSNGEDAVAINSYDPENRTFRTDRYLLGADAMGKVAAARGKLDPPSCGADEDAARAFGGRQQALKDLLPAAPNERLVYHCEAKR